MILKPHGIALFVSFACFGAFIFVTSIIGWQIPWWITTILAGYTFLGCLDVLFNHAEARRRKVQLEGRIAHLDDIQRRLTRHMNLWASQESC